MQRVFIKMWNAQSPSLSVPSHLSAMSEDCVWQFDAKFRYQATEKFVYHGDEWDERFEDADVEMFDMGRGVLVRGVVGDVRLLFSSWREKIGKVEWWTTDLCKQSPYLVFMRMGNAGVRELNSVAAAGDADWKILSQMAAERARHNFGHSPGYESYKGVKLINYLLNYEATNRSNPYRNALFGCKDRKTDQPGDGGGAGERDMAEQQAQGRR